MEGKMKKNRIKRIGKWSVSLLLALVLTTSAFSVPAFAQDPDLATLQDLIEESETVVKKQLTKTNRKDYTRDSWIAFSEALGNARDELRENGVSLDGERIAVLTNELTARKEGLVVVDAPVEGVEYGLQSDWYEGWDGIETKYQRSANMRGGYLYISDEVAHPEDDTVTVTVKWVNNGVDPLFGGKFHNTGWGPENKWGEYSLRPYSKEDLDERIYLRGGVTLNGEGIAEQIYVESLTEDEILNGFEKEFRVPAGSAITLSLGQNNTNVYVNSMGTYYTHSDIIAPSATVSLSQEELTRDPITVTIQANEAVQDVEGWTRSADGKTLTRVFTENVSGSVILMDLAGNRTEVPYEVQNIDTQAAIISGAADGETYKDAVSIRIEDDHTLAKVEIYRDEVLISSSDSFVNGIFTAELKDAGVYRIEAIDLAGNRSMLRFTIVSSQDPSGDVDEPQDPDQTPGDVNEPKDPQSESKPETGEEDKADVATGASVSYGAFVMMLAGAVIGSVIIEKKKRTCD